MSPEALTAQPGRHRRGAWIGAAAVAALILSSCGGVDGGDAQAPPSDDSPVQAARCPVDALDDAAGITDVTVWHPYNALTKSTLEAAADEYNASQDDVRVDVEAQGSYPEMLKKYEETLSTPEDLPDVIFSEDTTLQFMVDSGSVIAADDCIAADDGAAEFYDDLLGPVEAAYTVQGKLWAAAYGVAMPVMFVNRSHLGAAGLDTDEYPGTLPEVRVTAEQIAAADIPGLNGPVVMQLESWYPENWITGAGQHIVDEANGRDAVATASEFDNTTTIEIVEWLNDMQADGLLKAYPYSNDIPQFLAMANGTSSILIDGSRAITAVDAVVGGSQVDDIESGDITTEGLDIDVAPVPGVDGPGQGAAGGSAAFLVAGADEAQVAGGWDFLTFFNSTTIQAEWLLRGSYLPASQAVQDAPEVQAYFTDTRAGRWLSVANDQLLSVDASFPGPAIGPFNSFRNGVNTLLEDVVLGSGEPGPAITQFNDAFQADLETYLDEVGG